MSSISRLVQIGYVLGLSLILSLLLWPAGSQAQFGVTSGYRATPGLPIIAIPTISANGTNSASGAAGGIAGLSGGSGGASSSGSFSTQIMFVQLGDFFPNGGRIIGMPFPPLQPMLNNFNTDSSGAPWALLAVGKHRGGHGHGIGVTAPVIGSIGIGGMSGMGGRGLSGMSGMGGMKMSGMGGGIGMSSMGVSTGMGGFAGKGMGGFNGKKPL